MITEWYILTEDYSSIVDDILQCCVVMLHVAVVLELVPEFGSWLHLVGTALDLLTWTYSVWSIYTELSSSKTCPSPVMALWLITFAYIYSSALSHLACTCHHIGYHCPSPPSKRHTSCLVVKVLIVHRLNIDLVPTPTPTPTSPASISE
jgi:hypothetical protein